MSEKRDDLRPESFRWLVENRSRNQHASYELYSLLTEYVSEARADAEISDLAQGVVAVAFSLWRAVFLIGEKQESGDRFDDSVGYLEKVIVENTITFAQDRISRDWTAWYYLNNARYRLDRICSELNIRQNDGLGSKPRAPSNPRQRWEMLHSQFLSVIQELRRRLERKRKAKAIDG